MRRSHFRRHLKEQARKNIVLSLVGIGAVILLLAIFGVQLLIQFSLVLEKLKGNHDVTAVQEVGYIAPPVLNSMPDATSSAQVIISGYTTDMQSVYLYVNGRVVDDTTSDKDNNFAFHSVTLKPGANDIKAKVKSKQEKESTYSNQLTVTYRDKPPILEIESPQDGQSVSKDNQQIRITGKTDKEARITVNSFWAIVQGDGKFSYNFTLHDGDNDIKIEAIDDAGNKTAKEMKVRRE